MRQKGVSSIPRDCSCRHLTASDKALNPHTPPPNPRYSESDTVNIPVQNKTNITQRALKDVHINLALLPKEDLVYLSVAPCAAENLCKYLGRWPSEHRLHWRKQLPSFALFNGENVKSHEQGQDIAWQQPQDWTVPGLKQIASHFHALIPACESENNSTHCSFQSLKINENKPQLKYMGSYISIQLYFYRIQSYIYNIYLDFNISVWVYDLIQQQIMHVTNL